MGNDDTYIPTFWEKYGWCIGISAGAFTLVMYGFKNRLIKNRKSLVAASFSVAFIRNQ